LGTYWLLPLATARDIITLGVRDSWGNPVSIFFLVPIFWLGCFWIRDSKRLSLQPILRNSSLLINDLEWRILIPLDKLALAF